MNKQCSRCEKVVYPIEELKCLDKVWHKGCFKCQECGMTLSMKTYKGFNKLPYCEAHIPKAKATTVAETPEMKRLSENTKIQSNVQYHADFEKNKAKFTQVADDPETRRIKQNTKIISNASYHGDIEKKAIMEMNRTHPIEESDEKQSSSYQRDYQGYQKMAPQQEMKVQRSDPSPSPQKYRSSLTSSSHVQPHNSLGKNVHSNVVPHPNQYSQSAHSQQAQAFDDYPQSVLHYYQPQTQSHGQPAALAYTHSQHPHQAPNHPHQAPNHPHQAPNHPHQAPNHPHQAPNHPHQAPNHYTRVATSSAQNIYKDANHNSPYSARTAQTLIYSSQTGPVQQPTSTRRIGSIADYDPINEHYGSLAPGQTPHQQIYPAHNTTLYGDNVGHPQHPHSSQPVQHKITAPPTQLGRCYRALYDYEAADNDEVSFKDGDLIINCTSIDEGWMTGTVQRSNQTGMLPANYVERVS